MTSPVGGPPPQVPPPQPISDGPPILVINVPSPVVFGLLKEMVQIIHETHAHRIHSLPHTSVLLNQDSQQVELEAEMMLRSPGSQSTASTSQGTPTDQPEKPSSLQQREGVVEGSRKDLSQRLEIV